MSWDSKRENGATKWELKIAWTAILVDEGSLRREHQEGASEVGESPYRSRCLRLDICSINNYTWFH